MSEQIIFSFVLVLARVSAFIAFFPLFSRRQLPVKIKIGLAVALSIFWFGSIPDSAIPLRVEIIWAIILIGKEVLIGALLSMLVGFILIPARIAGSYIGQEIGVSMEPITNSGSENATVVTSLFETFAILIFFGLNLHHFMILMLHYSLNEFAGKIDLLNLPTDGLVGMVDNLSKYGLLIMAPLGVISFAIVVSLFFLTKAAPTLNLFSVGMPLRVGLGLLAMLIFLPVLWKSIEGYFSRMMIELEEFMAFFV